MDTPSFSPQEPGHHARATTQYRHRDDVAFRQAQAKLSAAAAMDSLHHLLVDSVRDYAIFALDQSGYILTWNVGAQRLKGYRPDEILGHHFSVFYTPDDIVTQKPDYMLQTAIHHGRCEDEGWRLRKDGSRFWGNVILTPLRDNAGTLIGFAKVTRDLTERKAAQEKALADARHVAEAEAANQAKSAFLAIMSHELRTPLNAIGGYAELLMMGLRGPVTDDQRRDLGRIQHNQRHLLGIITSLLTFSQVEARQLTYTIEPVLLNTVVDSVTAMIEPQAIAKGIALEYSWCRTGLRGLGDRSKVEQILLNLLSNAVKFTDAGGRMTVSCAELPGRVTISVRDTGIGIPADQLAAIFEPFVQVGRGLTRSYEGFGLGLAISRDLARVMNGEVTVESVLGQGSVFTLVLPTG